MSDVVFAFDGLEKFGFAEGGFYQLTNMAEKNRLLNITAPRPSSKSVAGSGTIQVLKAASLS